MISEALRRRFYPPGSLDGARCLWDWVRRHVDRSSVVLNLGAGPPTGEPIRVLKGEVARVVGTDIDPVVLSNPELDEAHVTGGTALPFPDGTFHAVVSDYVLEHVDHPEPFLREACRVLAPGRSFFFRTPNLIHYVSLISWLTPHGFHRLVANWARQLPKETHEPWPTRYRMNTPRKLARLARKVGFHEVDLRLIEGEPFYLRFHAAPWLVGVAYERLVNSSKGLAPFRVNIVGRLRK
jgi:SAM-dependent methyltransferase